MLSNLLITMTMEMLHPKFISYGQNCHRYQGLATPTGHVLSFTLIKLCKTIYRVVIQFVYTHRRSCKTISFEKIQSIT